MTAGVTAGAVVLAVALAWRFAFARWRRRMVVARLPGTATSTVGTPGVRAKFGPPTVVAAIAHRTLRGRTRAKYEAQLPAALDAIARSLRSGGGLRQALAEAAVASPGPVGADLATVARTAERGQPLVLALDEWAAGRPYALVQLVVGALALGAESGGAQARAVDGVAATARERLAVGQEIRALSSQARASAAVITIAPLAFCFLTTTTDARSAHFLFGTSVGWAVLAGGLGLDALAALWMARITRAGAT